MKGSHLILLFTQRYHSVPFYIRIEVTNLISAFIRPDLFRSLLYSYGGNTSLLILWTSIQLKTYPTLRCEYFLEWQHFLEDTNAYRRIADGILVYLRQSVSAAYLSAERRRYLCIATLQGNSNMIALGEKPSHGTLRCLICNSHFSGDMMRSNFWRLGVNGSLSLYRTRLTEAGNTCNCSKLNVITADYTSTLTGSRNG